MRCVNIGCHARRQSHVKRHVPQHQSQQIARAVASSAHSATINSIVNLTLVVSDSLNSGGAGQPPPSPSSTAVVSRTNPPPPPFIVPIFYNCGVRQRYGITINAKGCTCLTSYARCFILEWMQCTAAMLTPFCSGCNAL